MKINVTDQKGKVLEEMTLKKEVFGVEPNNNVLAQYIRVYLSNQRQGTSSTKTRGDVSGGGIKPWKQKGTGRARVGSSRNPLWRHGGISHGPQPRDWGLTMPKKMKKLAMFSALSTKYTNEKIKVLDKIELKNIKTSLMSDILKNLKLTGSVLLVMPEKNEKVIKSSVNIMNVKPVHVTNLNAYDVTKYTNLLFVKDAVKSLEKKYENK